MPDFGMAQIQYHAVWGETDGSGYAPKLDKIEGREICASKEDAEAFLDAAGWVYDDRALRRHKGGYTEARIWKIFEEDKAKWR